MAAAAAAGPAPAEESEPPAPDGSPPSAPDEVTMQPVVKSDFDKTPRNAPCPCGSGKKFKFCHGAA
jgi:preprotein translocase subunit SecA